MARVWKQLVIGAACTLLGLTARADDWPQWLGPLRDGRWRETGIVTKFPSQGLTLRWRAPVAHGYSGPSVAQGKVYVTDYVIESGKLINDPSQPVDLSGQERVLCLDAARGTLVWKHEYPCTYHISFPGGPRAAPTLAGGKVYTIGAMGDLCCLDANSGKPAWSKDLKKEYKTGAPLWGFSGHPLVDGKKLICLVGGPGSVVVAFDKDSGKELWRALSAREPGYCSPVIVEAGGRRQLIVWHPESINGLDPETGRVFWSERLTPSYGMAIATPRAEGEYLFGSGVGNAALLLKFNRAQPKVETVWRGDAQTAVYCGTSTPSIDRDLIFGVCRQGELRAVDLLTGKRLWETFAATTGSRRQAYATAFLVRHQHGYFLFNEQGDLILAQLGRDGYREISRHHLLAPTNEAFGRAVVWSHPAFANRCVYARNDKELICVSLAAE